MPPIDPTPHAGEVMYQPDEPKFPEPEPEGESDEPGRGQPAGRQPKDDDAKPSGASGEVDPLTHAGRDIAG